MQAFAVLLGLAAAACLYLAAPNQVLFVSAEGEGRAPLPPRLLGWLGLLLTIASAWTMSVPEGWPVAIAATLVTLTCSLSLWPFIGTWVHHRRGLPRREGSAA
ncbi:hypothetical protein SAMN05216321_102178 [Cupriavidus sp. OV038]|jgi:hypothetical protein|uniref:hypothetical protein n=1 Tax=unclassified Cupriavidus TaxID=2640874 RepID=UPI0008ED649F|nr:MULTISPECIES: hypothetical protein [unclassified Cupriavidus]SFB92320.1 hypothetical protein SAMN05216321_102178 [Cupriavidus sp. OV038]SFO97930.1 hypothetical protein SAMN05216322_103438 [Cupriavidus sp. OV096]